jgi:hypothetical protein
LLNPYLDAYLLLLQQQNKFGGKIKKKKKEKKSLEAICIELTTNYKYFPGIQ